MLGVLLQQPLLDVGLDVDAQPHPGLAINEGDQPAQLGRVLDLILMTQWTQRVPTKSVSVRNYVTAGW